MGDRAPESGTGSPCGVRKDARGNRMRWVSLFLQPRVGLGFTHSMSICRNIEIEMDRFGPKAS
jgi:hypothetical protein